jgi:hypothetical protein
LATDSERAYQAEKRRIDHDCREKEGGDCEQ